jgi:hypothetical protein
VIRWQRTLQRPCDTTATLRYCRGRTDGDVLRRYARALQAGQDRKAALTNDAGRTRRAIPPAGVHTNGSVPPRSWVGPE